MPLFAGLPNLAYTHRFALWCPHSLVNAQDQACRLCRTVDCVYLDQARLPNERVKVVADALCAVDVHTKPLLAVCVFYAQLVHDVSRIQTCIVANLPGDNFQCLRKRNHDHLELARNRQGMPANTRRDAHLRYRDGRACQLSPPFAILEAQYLNGASASYDVAVLDSTLHHHDRIV